jgi:hypothetical protein
MDTSQTNTGTGAAVHRWGLRREHNIRLGLHTTVLQAAIYAIKAGIM